MNDDVFEERRVATREFQVERDALGRGVAGPPPRRHAANGDLGHRDAHDLRPILDQRRHVALEGCPQGLRLGARRERLGLTREPLLMLGDPRGLVGNEGANGGHGHVPGRAHDHLAVRGLHREAKVLDPLAIDRVFDRCCHGAIQRTPRL